ncbi:MAG TPA: hypothetical protein VFZ65_16635 [Planctomycetota bacterium]|nr:hypothetical protein [Planctomycetota bacterium]
MVEQPSADWAEHLPGKPATLSFLPLAQGGAGESGWCTYAQTLDDAPDVEILCGGKNSKLPSAAAIWRQGNLLHFGFQQDPSQLNAVGRDLLENCIVYIAGFHADRPLAAVRSVFRPGVRSETRAWLLSVMKDDQATAKSIADRFFSGTRQQQLAAMDTGAARAWLRAHMTWLVPQPDGRLDVCPDLEALQLDVRAATFLPDVATALHGEAGPQAAACRVLQRHCPEGPRGGAEPAAAGAWSAFLEANQDYLFFSENAGCIWVLDPLAKARGVPSARLRGPARRG